MGGPVKAIREASPQARRRGSAARQRFQGLCRILRWPPGTEVVSITEIRRLAEQGDADAQFNLGVL